MIRPDFTSLRIFLAVHTTGNIARAAEREHIAPSAVSKRLQDLETDAGTSLFHRHARGVIPTAAGDALARHAHRLFDMMESMAAELSGFSGGVRGDVRIHAHSSAVVQYLPHEIAGFARHYPDVRVILREAISPDIIAAVTDGGADIGIFADNMGPLPGLTLLPYRQDRLAILLPRDHALAGQDEVGFSAIRDHDFISPESGSSLRVLLESAARDMGCALRFRIEIKTFEAAAGMAEAGLGVAVMPAGIAARYAVGGALAAVKLSDSWAHRNLVACVRDEDKLGASARLMLLHLRRAAADPTRFAMATVPNR
ncbi:MAG: LysR family transcriptional regulator [Janthinobacterium lividum]